MPELFDKFAFGCIHFSGGRYTSDEVVPAIGELADYLRANNRSGSPFVFVFAPNHIKTIIAYFAVMKAGLIAVPIDPHIKPLELLDLENDSQPCAHIRIDPATLAFDYAREVVFRPPAVGLPDEDVSDVCLMVYTAAEDGWYKGALLTRSSLLADAETFVRLEQVRKEDVVCALAPMYHTYALQTGVLGPLLAGASLLIEKMEDLHGIKTYAADIRDCKVTQIYTLPVVYYLLSCVRGIRESMASVKATVSGGYRLSEDIFKAFYDATGLEIHEGYGLTEASPICTSTRPGEQVVLGSVGRAYDCCEIAIFRPDEDERVARTAARARVVVREAVAAAVPGNNGRGRPAPDALDASSVRSDRLPIGEVGEIRIRGANVMKGYYGHREATRATLRDGWLRTGDIGRLDAEGRLYLTGLSKKMLNVGGKNLYPAEAERLFRQHEGVSRVEILGDESPLGGHVTRARIVLRGNSEQSQEAFRRWYRDNLSPYKLPKRVEFAAE